MSAATIVFDLDGTLVDTHPDLIGTLSWLLEEEGLDAIDLEAAKKLIGHGMKPMVEKALKLKGRGGTQDEIEAVYARYIAVYETRLTRESRPFPGMLEALDRLADSGMILAVCTNKIERLAKKLLDELDMTRRFAFIAGADTYALRKPDPRHILLTVRDAGGNPARAVMVGDSDTDIRAAQGAGVPVVAYSGGYTAIPLESLDPDVIIDHYDSLPETVARLLTSPKV
ncbi:MAG: HAD-IA family hydrolase [Phreatobacter sp.]|nr:HAD-IA family hydrolase [Phreatobacter sp.]